MFKDYLLYSQNQIAFKKWMYFYISVKGVPRNLKVTDETTDSFKITWSQAPGRVLRYRIRYRPVSGGESKEVTTPANQRRKTLENLTPDTKYEISVTAEYSSGLGSPLTGNAATEEGRENMTIAWKQSPSPCSHCGKALGKLFYVEDSEARFYSKDFRTL